MRQTTVGRGPELARIDAFLARVPDGARVLVIEGAPGMGKTTLWLAGLDAAADRAGRVLSARPSEAEATFAYAGIGDLLEGVDDAVALLAAPQRRALGVALLREEAEGPPPDRGAVAVAFLNTLRNLAREAPVVVAVDDVQWLDSASALALGFAIRRLRDEPVGILLARRVDPNAPEPAWPGRPNAPEPAWPGRPNAPEPAWPGRPNAPEPAWPGRPVVGEPPERIVTGPLGPGALGEILGARLDVRFPRATLQRIHDVSGGNPLFALEIGRALQSQRTALKAGHDLPLPDELMSLLGDQLAGLPVETQDALAVAAAVAYPTVRLLAQAVDGAVDRWLEAALIAHVLEIDDGRVRFTHPLLAAAARSRTLPARRRAIHARLAAIVDDPEERARHLALAADGPDETTVEALEVAAGRAGARGAPGAACELMELAGRLTPSDRVGEIRRRGLAEAEYARLAGDPLRARQIVEVLLSTWPHGSGRGPALALLGYVEIGLDTRTALALVEAALTEAGDDDRLRMRCEGLLTGTLDLLGDDVAGALVHGRAELEIAERLGDDVHIATALRGIARNEQRRTGRMPVELIERSLALEPLVRNARSVVEWPSRCYAEMLAWTDDVGAGLTRWEWLRQQALERGDENSLGWILAEMIPYECVAGTWDQARVHADECNDLAAGLGSLHSAIALADRALVEAHRGDAPAARRDAEEARGLGATLGVLMAERAAAWALGILELSLGNPIEADDQLAPLVAGSRAAGVAEPGDMRFVTDEVEALIGSGRFDRAEAVLGWYAGLAAASGRAFALAACDRCRGLLHAARGELDEAIAALEASRAGYAAIADPFGLGRTLLHLGAIQRRALHRRDARETLGASLAIFEGLGAGLWADRARSELTRIGGRRTSGDVLTPAERQVATLVAEGRTNREVAGALVLTERTVESHLSRIYAKMGVRSRAELAHRLSAGLDLPQ